MPGYKVSLKDPNVGPQLVCTICHDLLNSPRQTYCGHRACLECLQEATRFGPTFQCAVPACGHELTLEKVFPDKAVEREVLSLIVVCKNQGCDWQGTLRNYVKEEHEDKCEFKQITCSLCQEPVHVSRYKYHQDNACEMRHMPCPHCNEAMPFRHIQDHIATTCPNAPVDCDQCGKKGMIRAQLVKHQDVDTGDCPVKMVKCPFHVVGCQDKTKPENVDSHKKESFLAHQEMVLKMIDSLEQTLGGSQGNVPQVVADSEGRVRNLSEQLQSLLTRIQDLHNQASHTNQPDGNSASGGAASGGSEIQQETETVKQSQTTQNRKLDQCDSLVTQLAKKVETTIRQLEYYERERVINNQLLQSAQNKCEQLEHQISLKDSTLEEYDKRIAHMEKASYDGVLLWKITDVAKRREDAINGRIPSFYSPPFYTSRSGYKMCARVYLNGDGMGKNTHVSLFFVVMRGNYDPLLPWPFRQKVTLMLMDQNKREHLIDAFRPDPQSSSFKQPTSDMNIASGCPTFVPLTKLQSISPAYVRDDTMFIKIIVDCSELTQ